jgi:hypothetical protein
MAFGVKGLVGRWGALLGNNNEAELALTSQGSLAIAQREPLYSEASRSGARFIASMNTLTGIAPVQAWPTTAAAHYIYNGDPIKTYVIDYLGFTCLAGTPASGGSLLGLIIKPTGTLPTMGGYNVVNASGSGNASRAVIATGYTIPAIAAAVTPWSGWVILNTANLAAAAYVGGGDASDNFKDGRLQIQPGYGLALTVLSGAGTTPLFGVHAEWLEAQLDMQ